MALYDKDPKLPLTRMENLVLQCVFSGMPSQEVARILCVSRRTVDWHLYFSYRKLGVSNRMAAARRASALGALRPLQGDEAALLNSNGDLPVAEHMACEP